MYKEGLLSIRQMQKSVFHGINENLEVGITFIVSKATVKNKCILLIFFLVFKIKTYVPLVIGSGLDPFLGLI